MSSFDAKSEGNNSNQQSSDERDLDAQSASEPNGAATEKPARRDADALPDGSGSDKSSSGEDQGQESGEQSFDAG